LLQHTSFDSASEVLDHATVRRRFESEPTSLIDVGHSHLAYYRMGRGPDVLLVHGWPLHSATFRNILPALSREFTCHLFDLPGAGQTRSDANAPIHLAGYLEAVRRAVDRLELSRYAIVAHDSGGAIARMLTAADRRVSGLVLGNTELPGHRSWRVDLYARAARMPFGRALLRAVLGSPTLSRSSANFGACFAQADWCNGEFRDLFLEPGLASPERFALQLRFIQNLDWSAIDALEAAHARISAPVRLVWGASDPFFPIEKARSMMGQFAGPVDLRAIERGKLFAHEDCADEFVEHTLSFLRSISGESESATRAWQ
jgi:pimeloyl-ACP methyl ester carboxylesterase